MGDHEHALGMGPSPAYRLWCRKWGFRVGSDKTPAERNVELDWCHVHLPTWNLIRSIYPDPASLLEEVSLGRMDSSAIADPTCRAAAEGLEEGFLNCDDSLPARRTFTAFLSGLTRPHYRVVIGDTYVHAKSITRALVRVHHSRTDWIRDPADWRPPKRENAMFVVRDLIHFVFDEHNDVPCLIDSAWWMDGAQPRLWREAFIRLGKGASPSECALPAPLTRRGGHFFRKAPVTLLPQQGLRWAQVKALGGSDDLAMNVAVSRLAEMTGHDEFWSSALRFLVAHPDIPPHQVGPVIDYFRSRTPPLGRDATYSLKGRTVASVLRGMEEWHRGLHLARPPELRDAYEQSLGPVRPSRPFARVAGGMIILSPEATGAGEVWVVRQLLTAAELAQEGSDLKHCVATYARHCERGLLSIWSLDREGGGPVEARLTLTLTPDGRVTEARGLQNRLPHPHETPLIEAFAKAAAKRPGP